MFYLSILCSALCPKLQSIQTLFVAFEIVVGNEQRTYRLEIDEWVGSIHNAKPQFDVAEGDLCRSHMI